MDIVHLVHPIVTPLVTVKTGLGFVQGHWKWHHLIDRIRAPISVP